jgi:ATP-dependent DNA helicase RecG
VNAKEESLRTASPGPAIPTDLPYVRNILKTLPYALTHSQKQALWDVLRDMAKPIPMNRLIQGDVGSGKTVVAACAALVAHTAGYQTAYMAPTEVLAHQHLETFSRIAGNAPGDTPVVALLTARGGVLSSGEGLTRTAPKKEIRELVKRGEIHIVIGTHALIAGADPIPFRSLGLVMVDEQHRFGVRERARLAERKSSAHQAIPHFLSMSATPIPRTLMLTVFGNLALSVIDELPPGRTPVATHIYTPAMRSRAYALIRAQVALGHQAFVICPRIESADPHPDAAERKSVKKEFDALSKTIFRDLRIRMLHGQMKADEKKNVMRAFHDGAADILVATSVVEVGVDLPRATIIMIEGAERFGLAQLYQLRGRVGRSSFPSTCLLMTESDAAAKSPRLLALQRAANGFALAEEDLKLRGPGEFLGSAQTGLPDVAMDALKNPLLVVRTKEMAERLFAEDPSLRMFPELHETLRAFEADLHRE